MRASDACRSGGTSDEVLALGTAPAHARVNEVACPPRRVHVNHATRDLVIGPVSEPEQLPGFELVHHADIAICGVGPGAGSLADTWQTATAHLAGQLLDSGVQPDRIVSDRETGVGDAPTGGRGS
jgi:hypothetical protein